MMTSSLRALNRVRCMSTAAANLRDPVIGVISGSARSGSFNTTLAKAAGKMAEAKGATTMLINLGFDYALPLYSQDLEVDFPAAAVELKAKLASCDAWIIAGPEYNGFATPLLVNAITWSSRGDPPGEMYATFKGKTAAVIATSPGGLGGMRALNSYKELLMNLGTTCLPLSVAVGGAMKAFKEDGSLADSKMAGMLDGLITQLVHVARSEANREVACEILSTLKKAATAGEYGAVTAAT
ncbi:hypothetical protein CTAYLR_009018 [Chrysophaeum taylorii]|uniref:NADPH-dependent FMN reductase-like domain-containing protein n=1 Tax=Chrysophaeum taylorii TaxID=2483200 RepID=A0AAD7UDL7_9STRA|nr:hypothetical protein CTAYLR_009018 [Chrysophaeum taylorii]